MAPVDPGPAWLGLSDLQSLSLSLSLCMCMAYNTRSKTHEHKQGNTTEYTFTVVSVHTEKLSKKLHIVYCNCIVIHVSFVTLYYKYILCTDKMCRLNLHQQLIYTVHTLLCCKQMNTWPYI